MGDTLPIEEGLDRMPWKETCPVDQRVQFVAEWMKGERTMVELCRAYGVSRKTGYKWLERYDEDGPRALLDRSSRPCTSPYATDPETIEFVVAVKKQRPNWGPRKIRAWMLRSRSAERVPAASTIGEILKKRGLVKKRRRRAGIVPAEPFGEAKEPNDLWCTDFKGWFYVGRYKCHPLTIADAVSRVLLRAEGLHQPRTSEVQRVFRSAFWEFGLPKAIRSDNGPPFASRGPGGLTKLSAWWIRLGIRVERIRPGNPQENGRLERLHRTLKIETATVPKGDFREQQQAFDYFRRDYNDERPHEALGNRCPSEAYRSSSRGYIYEMDHLEMVYPEGFETRRTAKSGEADFEGGRVFVGQALASELVGFKYVSENRWQVYFGPLPLGEVNLTRRAKTWKLSPMSPV